jgi:hypothetical protein
MPEQHNATNATNIVDEESRRTENNWRGVRETAASSGAIFRFGEQASNTNPDQGTLLGIPIRNSNLHPHQGEPRSAPQAGFQDMAMSDAPAGRFCEGILVQMHEVTRPEIDLNRAYRS